jgi:sugar lactone lactonase YvrE
MGGSEAAGIADVLIGGTIMPSTIDCVIRRECLLGESPVWSRDGNVLYWVDIHKPAILRSDVGGRQVSEWPMPENVGSIGLADGGLVVALRQGFAHFNPGTQALTRLATPLACRANVRFNDGRVDRHGRFWAGTVSEKREPGLAALYRLDPDGACSEVLSGFTISNGISWSPDNRTMYFADSWERAIYAFDFDLDDGVVTNRRLFAQFAEGEGIPDGATVDADGAYWVAHFDGGKLSRYTPAGTRDRTIEMPVPRPTSCAFTGSDLRTLLITSASFGLSAEQREAAPLSGSVFAIDVGVRGLPDPSFGCAAVVSNGSSHEHSV